MYTFIFVFVCCMSVSCYMLEVLLIQPKSGPNSRWTKNSRAICGGSKDVK